MKGKVRTMTYFDLIKNSKKGLPKETLIIVGVNPIINDLIRAPQVIANLLRVEPNLKITIIYENETENFNQSLFYDKMLSREKTEFDRLQTYRNRLIGGKKARNKHSSGFIEDVLKECSDEADRIDFKRRLILLQNNLRHNINIIKADEQIWYSFNGVDLPTIDDYQEIELKELPIYKQIVNYLDFLLNPSSGGIYLSSPGDELIQLYDRMDYPRGIYPRKAFYSTEYQRYSVWSLIFNRSGEILLHKRSDYTADNRSLWDKSSGGHIDLRDSSTIITAKRELVEELFLPEAEFTKYMKAEIGDIIDFGEWNIEKRQEKYLKGELDGLDDIDWAVFRATDAETGDPLTIKRKSERIMHFKDMNSDGTVKKDEKGNPIFKEETEKWKTRFISDVFLFIAPEGFSKEQMLLAEQKGAASQHRFMSVSELIQDVIYDNPQVYTDDMVYICNELKWLLVQFSEFIRFIFE